MKPKPPKLPISFAYQLKPPSRAVDNVVRLRTKLIAIYAKYYSVNARKTITVDDEDERKLKAASPSKSLHEKPLLKSTNAKSVNFPSSQDRELQKSSTTFRKQPLAMAVEEKSKVIPENFSKGIANVEKTSSRSSPRSFDLLNDHWIKKWRETLSAESLEQQRMIAKEKLRLEAIPEEKDDLEIISQQVKDRMFGKQKIEQEKIYALPELTDEMNRVIDKALGHGAYNELLVELSIGRMTRADIITLRPQAWLNDEVVNAYFHMIAERSKKTGVSVHAFNTFFYPKLIKTGHTSLQRWTKKVDLFSLDIVLIPIHLVVLT
ncbi:sentrin-specific protease 1-like [Xenia sp. Carnegie-2017]|uniref:sentrin-specific protease 1-like n=1 Tax=Xenia sp. Carnegie-2017 TaxID=2897299 RepID=UPI001F04162A|nr:sentrin-specific protease 1-like [Xenia sp. Carnegie-2017]